jgi:ankyrin repeat protein
VKGNPLAIRTPDNLGGLPLHVACHHHESSKVVDYLVGLDPNTLTAVDRVGNTPLHVACLGANYDIIALLLEKYGALSVSKRSVHNKLPIDLLFESISVSDREGIDYIGSIFQLIRAYPESVMGNVVNNMRQEQQS